MRRLLRAGDRFWFVEASAAQLAILRIVVGTWALATLVRNFRYYAEIAGTSPILFDPVGLATFLDEPVSTQAFQVVLTLTLLASIAFLVGWRYRFSGPIFAGLFLWVLCYRNSWSMIYHTQNLIVLQVLVLGLTRAADALSLDALVRAPTGDWKADLLGSRRGGERAVGWEYGYAIRLLCAVAVITYFLAGVAKVAGPLGWAWAAGDAMRTQVAYDALRKELLVSGGGPPMAFILYGHTWVFTILGIATLALELGAPLALLHRHLALVWVVGALGMHWGIYIIMGIEFFYHRLGVAFVSFFDLERAARVGLGYAQRRLAAIWPRPTASAPAALAPGARPLTSLRLRRLFASSEAGRERQSA